MGEISTEYHSDALMMWRPLTQWLGRMGILVLLTAMFVGGSAGSIGGGIKIVRWLVIDSSH